MLRKCWYMGSLLKGEGGGGGGVVGKANLGGWVVFALCDASGRSSTGMAGRGGYSSSGILARD